MAEPQTAETFGFQTEAKQLLKLMIHSLYSNREIFLRELISNASDAIDKLRFQAIANPEWLAEDNDLRIEVAFDKDAKTLEIRDNGIGMTREEVIENLGTIARSGTAEFLAELSGDQQKDAALIGQFGVGFYSAFIVADTVEVTTRSAAGGDPVRWRSKGEDAFEVEAAASAPRGTSVVLHLKEDAEEFADDFRLRSIIRRYSDHIGVPVKMRKQATPEDGEDGEDGEADKTPEWEAVNEAQALWTRSRSDLSEDEYKAFYKHLTHDFEDPLKWSHNRVEGKLEYTSLLYLPKRAPFDLWNRDISRGLKLYVERVYIMDDAEQFLPLYLRFVKGVIDSSDLPLNVSREILQEDERIATIRNALTKRVLTMLDQLADKEAEGYQTFWEEFGEVLKEGVGEDFANREAIAGLLRFASTKSDDEKQTVGLDTYLERMADEQEAIYYLIAETHEHARHSPHLEVLKERGIEVLLLSNRIDEWMMGSLTEYREHAFKDVMRADLGLPGEASAEDEAEQGDNAQLTERITKVLESRVESVRISKRLSQSPACLVLSEHALGSQMRKIFEASGQAAPESKPIFEYNPSHPLLARLDEETDDDRFRDLTTILFEQAALAEGELPEDAAGYVNRLNGLLLELLARAEG